MAVNQVVVDGETIIDLTTDTVSAENLLVGATAHNAAGNVVDGAVAVAPASTTTPLVAGTAAVGTEEAYARGDHRHPAQTSVSGNAGTATQLSTARTIAISGGATGTATSFNGTANITIPVTALNPTKLSSAVPINKGGTGATTAAAALTNLGITATAAELNYVDGVTSNVQTQLNGKADISHTHTKSQITDFPSSLPADGGDSDTVNGKTVLTNVPENAVFTDTTYSTATTTNSGLMSANDKSKIDGIEDYAQVNTITGVKGDSEDSYRTGDINITKANIGLSNVDNTSDIDKPISNAQAVVNLSKQDLLCCSVTGNPVVIPGLQGGVPLNSIVVSGDNIIGQEMILNICGECVSRPIDEDAVHNGHRAGTWSEDGNSYTNSGITFTIIDWDRPTVVCNGTATESLILFAVRPISNRIPLIGGKTYRLTGCPSGGSTTTYRCRLNHATSGAVLVDVGQGATFTPSDDGYYGLSIGINSGTTVDNLLFTPEVYELNSGAAYTITPDANPYTVTADVRQVDGENNIFIVDSSNPTLSINANKTNPQLKMLTDKIDAISTAIVALGTE